MTGLQALRLPLRLLHACARHPVFRLRSHASHLVREFIPSGDTDRAASVEPSETARWQQPDAVWQSIPVTLRPLHRRCQRLRRCDHPARPQALLQASTRQHSPTSCHAWRGVEKHSKVVKKWLRMEPHHGHENWVLQALRACFTPISMTRLFGQPLRGRFLAVRRLVRQGISATRAPRPDLGGAGGLASRRPQASGPRPVGSAGPSRISGAACIWCSRTRCSSCCPRLTCRT